MEVSLDYTLFDTGTKSHRPTHKLYTCASIGGGGGRGGGG